MRGYKVLALGMAAVVAFTFTACDDQPTEPEQQAQFKKTADTGNGLPPGAHYTLHIHGADETLPRSTPDDSKQNMWVKLVGNTKILLSQGDYYVTDANGLDGTAAFRLPNPDVNNTGSTTYTVYAIGRGPGAADMTTCGYDPDGNLVCNANTLTIDNKGKDWTNAVRELLYLYDVTVCDSSSGVEVCTDYKRINLFHSALQGYFWDYDNNGLRLATLRFYDCSTTVYDEYESGYDDSACFQ
jgi:hypothetical protein